jgi:hypothetical protein
MGGVVVGCPQGDAMPALLQGHGRVHHQLLRPADAQVEV